MPGVMPALFLGHGNPMNAIERNRYTEGWAAMAAGIPRPKAILAISAHWYVPETGVTVAAAPRTIHDFGGFPRELYEVQYPAPGDPALARRVQRLLEPVSVKLDESWGLDHGAWAVLCHMYPRADVPVVELSIDETKPASFHYELGKRLAPLRAEGILLAASGNLVHNLHAYAWGRQGVEAFSKQRARRLAEKDAELVDYESMGRDARLSIPTPDHYLPLLYAIGSRRERDAIRFPVEGVDGGSVSMLAVQVGGDG